MPRRTLCLLTCLLALAGLGAGSAQAQPAAAFNPMPAAGDLILPLPKGGSLAFRPVFIGEGGDAFALRKFKMGDPQGGFKEYPTAVAVGGAFVVENEKGVDWAYYLGKYEVTQAQYLAVMGPTPAVPEQAKDSALPVTGLTWFEAQQFVDRLNQWLFANALNKLPQYGGAPGFIRLPSEIEWEFAARGGAQVSADDFDRRVPYAQDLAKHEWYSGPKSSHNKLKAVGLLAPNPLGLHDMLGNVAEMTSTLYQIEYYQGRSGGFVARGGHFLTSEKLVRSSLRTEEPFYLTETAGQTPQSNKKETMGLRLALSAIIYANRQVSGDLATAWEKYRGAAGGSLPAAVSVSPTSTQTQVASLEAGAHLERLKRALGKTGQIPPEAQDELGRLEAALTDIKFIRKQAEEDSAYAWAKIASESGFHVFREMRKLPDIRKLMTLSQEAGRGEMAERYKQRLEEIDKNVADGLATYSECFRQLIKIQPAAVQGGLDKYSKFLTERNAAEQVRLLKTTREHYEAFAKEQRADPEKWLKDMEALGAAR